MFHPGRRKRRQIMYDLAVGKAFCLKKDERKRFTYALRIALEAVVECDSAYSGKANLTCANVAVQIATDSSYNTSRDAVRRLIDLKYIFDDRRGKNKYIRIPEKTKKYLRRLDNLENRINKVVLREDGYIDCDVNSELKKLKRLKIYIGKSDSEMDEDMCGEVDLKAEADGRKSLKEIMTKMEKVKMMNVMKISGVLLAAIIFLAAPEDALADKAGTVGLEATLILR